MEAAAGLSDAADIESAALLPPGEGDYVALGGASPGPNVTPAAAPAPPPRRPASVAGSYRSKLGGTPSRSGRSLAGSRAGSVAGTVLEGHSKHRTVMEVVTTTRGEQRSRVGVCLMLYYERPRLYYGLWIFLLLAIVGTVVAVGVTQSEAWEKDYESAYSPPGPPPHAGRLR